MVPCLGHVVMAVRDLGNEGTCAMAYISLSQVLRKRLSPGVALFDRDFIIPLIKIFRNNTQLAATIRRVVLMS